MGPGFLGVVLWIRFLRPRLSGCGFSDTVVCRVKYVNMVFYTTQSLFGAPDNRIPNTGAEETASKNPYPESEDSDTRNRIPKTVSRKPGPKQPDPKRVRLGRIWFLRIWFWGMVFETWVFENMVFGELIVRLRFPSQGFLNTVF